MIANICKLNEQQHITVEECIKAITKELFELSATKKSINESIKMLDEIISGFKETSEILTKVTANLSNSLLPV